MVLAQKLTVVDEYIAKHSQSKELAERARGVFPSGVTHDARHSEPFPIYVTHASGSQKWDVDGNQYIDYWMGHGALLLGHNRPEVVRAAQEQLLKGTHYGACQELEILWGEKVVELVPCAEKVKFTSSGTEATMMAMRLARAFTGRSKILKFHGHFHGWHDYAVAGVRPPFDVPNSAGIPPEIASTMVLCPPNEIEPVKAALANRDVAAVILEPGGASSSTVPVRPGFLQALRDATNATDTVLIFDEVVTGFRYSSGGAQKKYGVTPDMCSMAKILAGGMPGGAVAGRADILARLEFRDDPKWNRFERVTHPGTYNANPLSAAAGIACLNIVGTGEPHLKADAKAARLRQEFNQVLRAHGVKADCYGATSDFHFVFGDAFTPGDGGNEHLSHIDPKAIWASKAPVGWTCAWRNEGVDLSGVAGKISDVHTEADLNHTVAAFDRIVQRLKSEGAM